MENLKKYGVYIMLAIFAAGMILALTRNPIKKKFMDIITEPIRVERDSLLEANRGLLRQIHQDTTLTRYKRERDSLRVLNVKLGDSLLNLKNRIRNAKKTIIDYGGTFDERLDVLTENVTD